MNEEVPSESDPLSSEMDPNARRPTDDSAESEAPPGPAARPRRSLRHKVLRELAYILILGTPVALFFLVAMPRSNAVKLLKDLDRVQVERTHFDQVEQLARRFPGYAACVGDNCLFQFENLWLHRLHLAPLTEFTVMVQRGGDAEAPGGGQVEAIDMAMLVSHGFAGDGDGSGAIASALVFDHAALMPGGPPYEASIRLQANGRPDRTVVRLSPGASAGERRRAREFNLRCLTRLGGCRNSHQLLPQIWNGAQRIQTAAMESLFLR